MEKIVPPIRKVGKPDGQILPSGHTTITTPHDIEDKVGWKTSEATESMFGKDTTH